MQYYEASFSVIVWEDVCFRKWWKECSCVNNVLRVLTLVESMVWRRFIDISFDIASPESYNTKMTVNKVHDKKLIDFMRITYLRQGMYYMLFLVKN